MVPPVLVLPQPVDASLLDAVVELWRAANVARGLAPSPARTARIREKLAGPDATVLIDRPAAAGPRTADSRTADPVAMALVEPGRADDGAGDPVDGYGHVSMVFVHPEHWGRGHGRRLLAAVHTLGWSRTTLWTRASNTRAQRLYAAAGYRPTGRTSALPDGDGIIQLERLRYEVARVDSRADADALAASMETRGHKQTYRVAAQ